MGDETPRAKSSRKLKTRLLVFLLVMVTLAVVCYRYFTSRSHGPANLQAHYVKHEFRIPMRDGVKLYTAVYVPKDNSRAYPFLLNRTPFGSVPYGERTYPARLGPSDAFDSAGYIFVMQDVRGRYQSEGQFIDMPPQPYEAKPGQVDESTDAYDTIEWLLHNVQNNNGRVGIWGLSYRGFFTAASIINSHPAIKAASPQAPVTDLFRGDDAYHNGAFMLAAQFELYSTYFRIRPDGPNFPPDDFAWFAYRTSNGYEFFLQHGPALADIANLIHNPLFDTNIRHNTFDSYWQPRDLAPRLRGIHSGVLNVGGWFDAEDLSGTLKTYRAIEAQNPGITNVLVMGPWEHGAWVRLPNKSGNTPADAAEYYRDQILFPFFESRLKGDGHVKLPEALVFETGKNVWRQYDVWPPSQARETNIYLHADRGLSFDAPKSNEPAYDEYVSDPEHPVPYVPVPPTTVASEYMYGDQRFAAARSDVVTYVSDPLTDDVTVAGPVSPQLFISSTGSDSDFDVKLIDVSPDGEQPVLEAAPQSLPSSSKLPNGYERLVRGEPMRARFRNSLSHPQPLTPNEVVPVRFDMADVYHTFLRGHRIMVQVQSSWFPLTDLNPQKFVDTASARKSDFTKETERVYHTPAAPSSIRLHILPAH
jgi:uncharacterized protein